MSLVFSSIRSSSRSTLEKAFLISNNLLSSGRTRWKHTTVRLIAVEDLPSKKGYKGDVINVKPGYARNYLVPKKKAVYATPQNFAKFGFLDPDLETAEEREARRQQESSLSKKEEQYLKDADLLKKYLKNKVVSNRLALVLLYFTPIESLTEIFFLFLFLALAEDMACCRPEHNRCPTSWNGHITKSSRKT